MPDLDQLGEAFRMRQLIDRLPAMVAYWDGDLRNVVANDAHREFFGKTPGEIQGMHITDLLTGELGEASLPYIHAAMAGDDQIFEKTISDHHGVHRHVQAAYLPDIVDGRVQGLYVQVIDVTARVEAQRARDDAQRLFQITMDSAPLGTAVVTRKGHTMYVNPALCLLLGHDPREAPAFSLSDGIHPDDAADMRHHWQELLAGTVPEFSAEVRYIRSDGHTIWLHLIAVVVPAAHGDTDLVVAQVQDITARIDAEADLARLAVTDPLTGLHNRHALVARIAEHRNDHPSAPVGGVFIDLDGFKQVNDRHGHAAGDEVLEMAAARLAEVLPDTSTAYRLGGDEFFVLVLDDAPKHATEETAATIRSVLTGTYRVTDAEVALTASVGWACSVTADAAELIRAADADMYRHKATASADREA